MSDSPPTNKDRDRDDEIALSDIFKPVIGRGRWIARMALLTGVVAAIAGGAFWLLQPATRTWSMQFRPTFDGLDKNEYPNGLPFSSADIVSPAVVNQVYAKNQISNFCSVQEFQGGLVVQESSPELQFLQDEYEIRMADARLTSIDRQRLQEEFRNRRTTLLPRYALEFIQPRTCAAIPKPVVSKALRDILETWATDAVDKRGVLKLRVAVLTPAIFEQADSRPENELIRADLLRNAVGRVISNILAVEALPGAELVRGSDKHVSFAEVRAELEDLQATRLSSVLALAGRGLGDQARRWAEQALQTAMTRQRIMQDRADAYSHALREYSGVPSTATQPPGASSGSKTDGDVRGVTAQIDNSFIDRIVDLTELNTTFKQEITREAIAASVEAVDRAAVVKQYEQLISWLEQPAPVTSDEPVGEMLDRFSQQAKEATRRFNQIYEEFSNLSTTVGPAMYVVERPTYAAVYRSFDLRSLFILVLLSLIVVPIVLAMGIMAKYHGQQFVARMR